MKTPDTTKAVSSATRQGAQIIGPGGLPAKLNTVTAEVLARLLNYERLTSLDAVDEASTTRLSAVTFYLSEKYGWPIEVVDKAAGCRDGWRLVPGRRMPQEQHRHAPAHRLPGYLDRQPGRSAAADR